MTLTNDTPLPVEPAAPTAPALTADTLALRIAAAEATADQLKNALTATDLYQHWQQQIGKLNGLRELYALLSTPAP